MRQYLCQRVDRPIEINGYIDPDIWRLAEWTGDFVDILGEGGPVPRYRTRAKMLWDELNLYIAAELEEPHVWGTLTERDSVIFQDNDFEVFIDPDGDNHLYVELELNALNTTWDLLLTRPYRAQGKPLTGWRIRGLQTGVKVLGTVNDPLDIDEGWTLTIAIPWSAMAEIAGLQACPPKPGDQWRINFSRVQWPHWIGPSGYEKIPGSIEDNWVWSAQGVVDMHRPGTWGIVQFADGPSELTAYPGSQERPVLLAIYEAQLSYRERQGEWAGSVSELGDYPPATELQRTFSSFEARLNGWHIDSHGRTWHE